MTKTWRCFPIAATSWLAMIPNAYGWADCTRSLNTIYEAEKLVQDDSIVRKYVLCPNTEFYVALNFGSDGRPLDGQYPIPVARPNVHVFCGEEGRSENNCQLVRGLIHVGMVDEYSVTSPAANIILQGLTFLRAASVNVVAMIGGHITINDCIFKRNRNVAAIFAVAPDVNVRRRSLLMNNDPSVDFLGVLRRRLFNFPLNTTRADLNVTVSNCLFSDNVLGASSGAHMTSVIHNLGASLVVTHSTFVGTTRGTLHSEELPRIIFLESGLLVLQNNCFIGNSAQIAAVVAVGAAVKASRNFNQRTTSELPASSCEFISQNATPASGFVCEASDSSICTAKSSATVTFPCATYLDDIYFSEWDVTDNSVTRTYLLCPNTIFRVGSRHDQHGAPLGGSYPIILGRSNVRILCGASGSASNSCDVINGVVQVAHFDEFQNGGRPIVNTGVSGISFGGASAVNALISGLGEVSFKDCLFHDNANAGSILVRHLQRKFRERRSLSTVRSIVEDLTHTTESEVNTARESEVDGLVARLDSCVFVNNEVGSAKNPLSGLVSNYQAKLILSNSIITNTTNVASKEYLGYWEVGFLVGNFEGEIELENNCFFDNEVSIAPVINQGSLKAANNSGRQELEAQNIASARLPSSFVTHGHLTVPENKTSVSLGGGLEEQTQHEDQHKGKARCEFIAIVPHDILGSINPDFVRFTCLFFDSRVCDVSWALQEPTQSPASLQHSKDIRDGQQSQRNESIHNTGRTSGKILQTFGVDTVELAPSREVESAASLRGAGSPFAMGLQLHVVCVFSLFACV